MAFCHVRKAVLDEFSDLSMCSLKNLQLKTDKHWPKRDDIPVDSLPDVLSPVTTYVTIFALGAVCSSARVSAPAAPHG